MKRKLLFMFATLFVGMNTLAHNVASKDMHLSNNGTEFITTNTDNDKFIHYLTPEEAAPHIPLSKNIDKILRSRKFKKLKSLCTEEGWKHVQKLLIDGDARISGTPNIQFLENPVGITLRSFPMSFRFGNSNRNFNEDVVFHINREGKITHLAFAYNKSDVDKVFGHRGAWSDQEKQAVANMMETYKTAFSLHDIDCIKRLCSESTLFIGNGNIPLWDNFQEVFSGNDYINIKFDETDVKKAHYKNKTTGESKEVHGIQFKQQLFTEHHSSVAYIFFAVDISDAESPKIIVSSWQTEEEAAKGKIGLENIQ